jgi:hypothetical protein
MNKNADLRRLYNLLNQLEVSSGGKRTLAAISAAGNWPSRGIYLFFEHGENRTGSGDGPRLVRIGTHALTNGAKSTLRQRLRQHAGNASGSTGNHRGSIFRLLIGEALIARGDVPACASWGVKGDMGKAAEILHRDKADLAKAEAPVESAVSAYISYLPFLWLSIEDEPGPESLRGYIERNTIALTSNLNSHSFDPPSPSWLGLHSGRDKVRRSGLWNQRHVDQDYSPKFLDTFEAAVEQNASLSSQNLRKSA